MQKSSDGSVLNLRISAELDAKLERIAEALGLHKSTTARVVLAHVDEHDLPAGLRERATMLREIGAS